VLSPGHRTYGFGYLPWICGPSDRWSRKLGLRDGQRRAATNGYRGGFESLGNVRDLGLRAAEITINLADSMDAGWRARSTGGWSRRAGGPASVTRRWSLMSRGQPSTSSSSSRTICRLTGRAWTSSKGLVTNALPRRCLPLTVTWRHRFTSSGRRRRNASDNRWARNVKWRSAVSWPLMLRAGWVVVRRRTLTSPSPRSMARVVSETVPKQTAVADHLANACRSSVDGGQRD